ncbi:hypothetical protein GQX74_012716 [Glossina fuscipes]|nr:hypothetical protein GQX74_012716 [Glossina fuscipes]
MISYFRSNGGYFGHMYSLKMNNRNQKKVKRKTITLETKIAILNRLADGEGSTALGKEYKLGLLLRCGSAPTMSFNLIVGRGKDVLGLKPTNGYVSLMLRIEIESYSQSSWMQFGQEPKPF